MCFQAAALARSSGCLQGPVLTISPVPWLPCSFRVPQWIQT